MNTFKVQKIRSCVACGDVLSLKCIKCIKHPERKPQVLELHDWPPILKTAECGCCIQIRCQGESCTKTMWRNVKHNRDGLATAKRSFCSIFCAGRALGRSRLTSQTVPCDWCQKLVLKKAFAIKTWKKSFCNKTCYFLRRAKDHHDAKEAKRKELDGVGGPSLLQCLGKCRGMVTEHVGTSSSQARCKDCGGVRDARVLTFNVG